nr:MAG TPA: hypothetical protein [Inoviridae sp.]
MLPPSLIGLDAISFLTASRVPLQATSLSPVVALDRVKTGSFSAIFLSAFAAVALPTVNVMHPLFLTFNETVVPAPSTGILVIFSIAVGNCA